MSIAFKKATKEQAKLRMAIHGPAGSGKTFSALSIAKGLCEKVAVLDTEHGSASKYSDTFDFDVVEITENYHPDRIIETLDAALEAGYECLIIDSMTHFWNGPGGFLSLVDEEAKRSGKTENTFTAWKKVDPIYKRVVQHILSSPLHVIVTARAKQAYELTKDERGKNRVEKLGMSPELREGFQYELDIEAMLDMDHNLVIGKTRCQALDGRVFTKPGKDLADILKEWLTSGTPVATPATLAAPFFARIEAATTRQEMQAISSEIAAIEKGKLNGHRQLLLDAWKARRDVLAALAKETQAAPAEADPPKAASAPAEGAVTQ